MNRAVASFGALAVLVLSHVTPAAAAGIAWSIKLLEGTNELEVQVDTRKQPAKEAYKVVVFYAAFKDVNGTQIDVRRYSYLDGALPKLTGGHLYQRRFTHDYHDARSVSGSDIIFGEYADGGQALKMLVAATGTIPGTPDVTSAKTVDVGPSKRTVCGNYASTAVQQQRKNTHQNCNLSGPRWSEKFGYHYNWCIGGHDKESLKETLARSQALVLCEKR